MASLMRENSNTVLPVMKPKAVLDYSKNMGSIDTTDMLLSYCSAYAKPSNVIKNYFSM